MTYVSPCSLIAVGTRFGCEYFNTLYKTLITLINLDLASPLTVENCLTSIQNTIFWTYLIATFKRIHNVIYFISRNMRYIEFLGLRDCYTFEMRLFVPRN